MNKDRNLINKTNVPKDFHSSIIAEFTVNTDEEHLSALLNNLSKNNLDICAYYISEDNKKLKFVFIVGKNDTQSSNDISLTRKILEENKYNFNETKVVRLSSSNKDDLLAYHYRELMKTLTVYNSYICRDGSIIYETCCPTKTVKVLDELS